MKKIITNVGVLIFASVILCSCGGKSVETDAQKLADVMCKSQNLAKKRYLEGGEVNMAAAMKERQKLISEAASLNQEMIKKYSNQDDYQEFTAAYIKALRKCK